MKARVLSAILRNDELPGNDLHRPSYCYTTTTLKQTTNTCTVRPEKLTTNLYIYYGTSTDLICDESAVFLCLVHLLYYAACA